MYICNTEKFKYKNGYLHLPITLKSNTLPKALQIRDITLQIKSSFHVSLVCIKNIVEGSDIENLEEKIINLFCEFIQEHEVAFESFTGEFRLAQREEDGRKSLVAMCNIRNLKMFFDTLNSTFNLNIPYQPTHVSLYTLEVDKAIGLNSQEDIERMTENVSRELTNEFIEQIMLR